MTEMEFSSLHPTLTPFMMAYDATDTDGDQEISSFNIN